MGPNPCKIGLCLLCANWPNNSFSLHIPDTQLDILSLISVRPVPLIWHGWKHCCRLALCLNQRSSVKWNQITSSCLSGFGGASCVTSLNFNIQVISLSLKSLASNYTIWITTMIYLYDVLKPQTVFILYSYWKVCKKIPMLC